jgi:hypothetical protein
MKEHGPDLWSSLLVALGLGLGAAGFVVALVGKPTWTVRIGAIGLVVVILLLVAIWHWGFREGAKWHPHENRNPRQEKVQ